MKTVNKFEPNQLVWMFNEITGKIINGVISDQFCNKKYKFNTIPVNMRTIIPVIWDDKTNGAIHFKELKAVIF